MREAVSKFVTYVSPEKAARDEQLKYQVEGSFREMYSCIRAIQASREGTADLFASLLFENGFLQWRKIWRLDLLGRRRPWSDGWKDKIIGSELNGNTCMYKRAVLIIQAVERDGGGVVPLNIA